MTPTYALLGLLLSGERHGYDLKRTIDQEFAPYWRIDFGQLYRSLAKMQERGWVKAHSVRGSGGPARKVYALTAQGRHTFDTWLAEPAHDRNEFFVKLRLAAVAGVSADRLVAAQREALYRARATHTQSHRRAREAKDAARLVLADAALRETEASLSALDLWSAVEPAGHMEGKPLPDQPVITGSDDPLLARLAQLASTLTHPVGSIGGLLALGQHQADVAGTHLLDRDTGEYNVPFVKHLLPEDEVVLVNLAFRENGLLIAHDNPKHIRRLRDLTRGDIRFVNRQTGAGTRLLLYSKLRAAHINPHTLTGWDHAVSTHDAVASAIVTGAADVGPGLRATAAAWDLDFIPLGQERYDLAMTRAAFESDRLETFLKVLHSKEFRSQGASFEGYDLTRTGRVVARIK